MTITPPITQTATNHSLVIRVEGQVIGAINEWSPDQSQTVTPAFEFGAVTNPNSLRGVAYELVPGNITGTNVRIARYDLFASKFEKTFGSFDLTMLSGQNQGMEVVELLEAPDAQFTETKSYSDFWFTNIGRRHDAKGDRIIMVNASAMYRDIRLV